MFDKTMPLALCMGFVCVGSSLASNNRFPNVDFNGPEFQQLRARHAATDWNAFPNPDFNSPEFQQLRARHAATDWSAFPNPDFNSPEFQQLRARHAAIFGGNPANGAPNNQMHQLPFGQRNNAPVPVHVVAPVRDYAAEARLAQELQEARDQLARTQEINRQREEELARSRADNQDLLYGRPPLATDSTGASAPIMDPNLSNDNNDK